MKFRACYHKKREVDETETSRDGILNQSSLTGCVICYREKNKKNSHSISNAALRNEPGNHLRRDGTETSRDGILPKVV